MATDGKAGPAAYGDRDEDGTVPLLLGNGYGDGGIESVSTVPVQTNIGTDTRLSALSDHLESIGSGERAVDDGGAVASRQSGNTPVLSALEAEEVVIQAGTIVAQAVVTEEGEVPVESGTSGPVQELLGAVEAGNGHAAPPAEMPQGTLDEPLPDMTDSLDAGFAGTEAASTVGLAPGVYESAGSHGAETATTVKQAGRVAVEMGRMGSGETASGKTSHTAGEAVEENAADGESAGAKPESVESREHRPTLKGMENAISRLRENRTVSDAEGVKRLVEQASAEADGNGNKASQKVVEGQEASLKSSGTSNGSGQMAGAGLGKGLSMGSNGTFREGGNGFGKGETLATQHGYAALLGRDGELRSMNFSETIRAATTGATAAEGIENTMKVYERFSQAIKLSFLGGGKQVNLRLSPEHLGRLQIKLTGEGSSVTAKVIVDSVAVKNLLESDSGKLKELFSQQGLNMEEYTVEVRGQSVGADDSRSAELWERHGNKGGSGRERHETVTVPVEQAVMKASIGAAYGSGASRGVDLFV